jgi:hypothetical protein
MPVSRPGTPKGLLQQPILNTIILLHQVCLQGVRQYSQYKYADNPEHEQFKNRNVALLSVLLKGVSPVL